MLGGFTIFQGIIVFSSEHAAAIVEMERRQPAPSMEFHYKDRKKSSTDCCCAGVNSLNLRTAWFASDPRERCC